VNETTGCIDRDHTHDKTRGKMASKHYGCVYFSITLRNTPRPGTDAMPVVGCTCLDVAPARTVWLSFLKPALYMEKRTEKIPFRPVPFSIFFVRFRICGIPYLWKRERGFSVRFCEILFLSRIDPYLFCFSSRFRSM